MNDYPPEVVTLVAAARDMLSSFDPEWMMANVCPETAAETLAEALVPFIAGGTA